MVYLKKVCWNSASKSMFINATWTTLKDTLFMWAEWSYHGRINNNPRDKNKFVVSRLHVDIFLSHFFKVIDLRLLPNSSS